jgi:hypothetical protein
MKTIQAKNKIDALKQSGYENIYFSGNKPYSITSAIYTYKVFAIRLSTGNYMIISERI